VSGRQVDGPEIEKKPNVISWFDIEYADGNEMWTVLGVEAFGLAGRDRGGKTSARPYDAGEGPRAAWRGVLGRSVGGCHIAKCGVGVCAEVVGILDGQSRKPVCGRASGGCGSDLG